MSKLFKKFNNFLIKMRRRKERELQKAQLEKIFLRNAFKI